MVFRVETQEWRLIGGRGGIGLGPTGFVKSGDFSFEVTSSKAMNLPEANECYASKHYWDDRYSSEDSFDWFVPYKEFRDLVLKTVNFTDRILILGCGNSPLSVDLYEDGFHHIINIDYSDIVINKMKEHYSSLMDMEWRVMDVRNMSSLEQESFDVILEKGTLDALLVEEKDPWSLSEVAEIMVDSVLTQVSQLLKPGGRFISVTFAQPHFRLPLYALLKYCWNTSTDTIGSDFHYFYYVMTKGQALSSNDLNVRANYLQRKELKYSVVPLSESEDEDYLFKGIDLEQEH